MRGRRDVPCRWIGMANARLSGKQDAMTMSDGSDEGRVAKGRGSGDKGNGAAQRGRTRRASPRDAQTAHPTRMANDGRGAPSLDSEVHRGDVSAVAAGKERVFEMWRDGKKLFEETTAPERTWKDHSFHWVTALLPGLVLAWYLHGVKVKMEEEYGARRAEKQQRLVDIHEDKHAAPYHGEGEAAAADQSR